MRRLGVTLGLGFLMAMLALLPDSVPVDPVPIEVDRAEVSPEPWHRSRMVVGKVLPASGPEDVALDHLGRAYAGLDDGSIVRWRSGSVDPLLETFADTGGRPLGLDFDGRGELWVADSTLGLLSIGSDGRIHHRSSRAGTLDIGFANDVAAGPDGRIYVSDSSTRFGPEDLAFEVLESRPHGRLLRFDPATGGTEVLLDDLYFANGVAVSRSGEFVLVAETFRYRIRRYWLAGPGAGTSEILIDNLPGFPDGVSANEHGTFWVAIYRARSPVLDRILHPRPWLKRLVARLPRFVLEDRSRFGMVLEIDDEGEVLRTLEDAEGEGFFSLTSVEEHDGRLYLASIEMNAIGIVSVPP